MADWRYIATRLHGNGTETVIHNEVPLGKVSITDTLSGPQALKGTLTPEMLHLLGSDGEPIFDPWATGIYAEKDGLIRAGGIVSELFSKGSSLDVNCIGFSGYLKDMPWVAADYNGVNVDPLDVLRLIWAHVQSQTGSNLGVSVDALSSAYRIGKPLRNVAFTTGAGEDVAFDAGPFMMNEYSTHDLLAKVNDLIKGSPFDYREVHYWIGENIGHRIELAVPAIGRRRTDLRFVTGENVYVDPDTFFDGEAYASSVMVLGSGEGAKMVRDWAHRSGETRLRRVRVIDVKDADTKAKARTAAAAELAGSHGRPEIDEIKVLDHPHAPLGSYGIGDEIFVQSPEGWQGDLGLWARITSITTTPDDENVATLSLLRSDRI